MVFHSKTFLLFFALFFPLFLATKKSYNKRIFLSLVFSYVFYGWWDWRYLGLILLSSSIDWFLGLKISETDNPLRRKTLLGISLFLNLGILFFFKYSNFFLSSAVSALQVAGFNVGSVYLNVILPVGISFFTFQAMSYTIDIYRKQCAVCYNYFEFLVFVSFFPQLVAGPIVRASDFLPQLKDEPIISTSNFYKGISLFGIGLFKKILIADLLAVLFVDSFFKSPQGHSALDTLLAVYGYSFQIYADFSGYTDMAIGLALMLGYHFPENFATPYVATSMKEFWNRWHISLSTWLRDYLYIPLGGNRGKSPLFKYRNIAITMLLGGLWHGANWTFVIWGAIHAVAITINHIYNDYFKVPKKNQGFSWIKWFVVYNTVCFAWIFFRAESLGHALQVIRNFGPLDFTHSKAPTAFVLCLIGAWVFHVFEYKYKEGFAHDFGLRPFYQKIGYCTFGLILILIFSNKFSPFIYFQF